MANIHGAMLVCEKRIRARWEQLATNRAELDVLCAASGDKAAAGVPSSPEKSERFNQLLTENRNLLQEIDKQYQALFQIRNR